MVPLRVGIEFFKLAILMLIWFKSRSSVFWRSGLSWFFKMLIWLAYCCFWLEYEATVPLMLLAWIYRAWKLACKVCFWALITSIWLLSLTLSALYASIAFLISFYLALSNKILAYKALFFSLAASNCFIKASIKASVSVKEIPSTRICSLALYKAAFSLFTFWLFTVMLRLNGVKSTFAALNRS